MTLPSLPISWPINSLEVVILRMVTPSISSWSRVTLSAGIMDLRIYSRVD